MGSVPEMRNLDVLLEKHFQKKVKILEQHTKPLTAPGENYGSVMVALDVKIEDENKEKQDLNLVAKLIPRNEMLKEMFQVQITFIKELKVYTKIAPTLAELEDEYGILEDRASDLFAKCYGGRSNLNEEEGKVDDDSVLLLENLKTVGFETGDRLVGFNFETARFILRNLARFHATPIALKSLRPEKYEEVFTKTLVTPHSAAGLNVDKSMKFVEGISNIINVNEGFEEQVQKVKQDLAVKLTSTLYSSSDPKSPFLTFCHSDFWVNNMMLKRNVDGQPEKLMIVDFQTPQNQTLVSDLLFFIYSSVSPLILYDKIDELLKIYYDSFISRLKQFNLDLDAYSWDEFMLEIKKNAIGVLSQILIMYKPILTKRGQIESMDTFKEDDMLNIDSISDYCKSCMVKTFEQFAQKEWI